MRALLVLVLASSAHAAPAVDWSTGMVTATGVGVADRQAPNPAIARGTSRRKAEDAAKKVLAVEVAKLPVASGGTVADTLSDKTVKERIDRAVAEALTVEAEPETDGAWTVTLAVPTEAVRQAIVGPRILASQGDSDTTAAVIVVEGAKAQPAIGVTVGGVAGATLWVKTVPDWAKNAPRVKAKAGTGPGIDAAVKNATESTLFVIVTK